MLTVQAHSLIEIPFHATKCHADPWNELELDVVFSGPGGDIRVPGYWTGDDTWAVRFAAPTAGGWTYHTMCSDESDTGLHGTTGKIDVRPYEGANALLSRGRLRISANGRHLETADGQPFFWLADTWWMGLAMRLDWPEGFQELAMDRVAKGYSVVQIIAGPYPDMEAFDHRGANEAGHPFTEGFASVNPAYFDMADLKIGHIVRRGISPCIVGMWGYFLPQIGVEKIKRYWRYLIARYGAYPVTWCIAGEARMAWYLSDNSEAESAEQGTGWTEVCRYVRDVDGFENPITIHPTQIGREQVDDPSVMDFEMLQTGHGGYDSIVNSVDCVRQACAVEPPMPTFVSEACYEGILGRSEAAVQRMLFWMTMLSGAMGFTYGANGIWQMSTDDDPYGPSPHGRSWGMETWDDAYKLPGSKHVGVGAKFLSTLPWTEFEVHDEWIANAWDGTDGNKAVAAGIPGRLRVMYAPMAWNFPAVLNIETDVTYTAKYFDPVEGGTYDLGIVEPDADGTWTPTPPQVVHDWVLVLEKV